LPLALLCLKIGSPVILLRNLDSGEGLCNGTRMVVLNVRRKVLQCRIINKDRRFRDKVVLIPRIRLLPNAETLCHSRDFNSQSGWPLLWLSTSLKDSQWSMWGLICKHQCSSMNNFMCNEQPICRRSRKHSRLTLGASYYSYCVHAI